MTTTARQLARQQIHAAPTRLRAERLRWGLTLRGVSAATGVAVSQLSTMERGKLRPGAKAATRLSEFYEIPVRELFVARWKEHLHGDD